MCLDTSNRKAYAVLLVSSGLRLLKDKNLPKAHTRNAITSAKSENDVIQWTHQPMPLAVEMK